MRTNVLIYCLAVLGAVLLGSCQSKNNPEWKEEYKEASFYVVKFNPLAAAYRPNVMLVPDSKGHYRMRSLANGGTCREFIYGHSPFTEIDTIQHWYLADWKWGVLLSKNHVVLPLRWVDVAKPDEVYSRADIEVAASGIIDKLGIVKRSEIDQFLYLTPAAAQETPGSWGQTSGGISTDHLAPVYLSRYYSTQDIPAVIAQKGDWQYTKEDFLRERLRQDSLQEVYRERLAQLIYANMGNFVIHTTD